MPSAPRRFVIEPDGDGLWRISCQDCDATLAAVPDHEIGALSEFAVAHDCH